MSLINKSKNRIIIRKVKIAKTYSQRLRGLMFRRKPDYALIFPSATRQDSAIHMLFVFYSIDVLFLDSKRRVVDKVRAKPFAPYYAPKRAAKYIIELPCGLGKRAQTGDVLDW